MTEVKEDKTYDLGERSININSLHGPFFYKKTERSDSTLRHSIFDIRYSAVRFSMVLRFAVPTMCRFWVRHRRWQIEGRHKKRISNIE